MVDTYEIRLLSEATKLIEEMEEHDVDVLMLGVGLLNCLGY